MDALANAMGNTGEEQEYSFKNFFVRLTTYKTIIFFIVIGLLVYLNSLFTNFIWDDIPQIVNNPNVHSLASIPNYFFAPLHFTYQNGRFYRPLMFTFITINYVIFGKTPFFFHVMDLSFHILNASLIFIILKRFMKIKIAFASALIFLVHPINVETVLNLSHIQDVLFLSFGLLAVYFTLKDGETNIRSIVYVSFFLLFSYFSKETGLLFTIMLIIYGLLINRHKLKLIFLSSAFSIIIYLIIRGIAEAYYADTITPSILQVEFITAPKIAYQYILTFLFPVHFAIYQTWLVHSISSPDFIYPLLFDIFFTLLIFFGGYVLLRNKKSSFRIYLFFLIWFFIGIIFHLQLWALEMTYADRWFYFPMVGLLGMLGIFISSLTFSERLKVSLTTIFILLCILLCTRTIIRNNDWQDMFTLASHDAAQSQNPLLYQIVIDGLIQQGKLEQAKQELTELKKVDAIGYVTLQNEGELALHTGDFELAQSDFVKLLNTPRASTGYEGLVYILILRDHNYTQAERLLKSIIVKYPQNSDLWELLSITEQKLGKQKEAVQAAEEFYHLQSLNQE